MVGDVTLELEFMSSIPGRVEIMGFVPFFCHGPKKYWWLRRAWGSAGALRETKRGGNRPRHGLPHDRNYNQSNNVASWANIRFLPMVPMKNIAFAVRTWPVHGGSAGALREKKRSGYRPRHALGHGRIYNQSNDVGCWAKIRLLPMVPPRNEEYTSDRKKRRKKTSWFQCGIFSRGKSEGSSLRSLVIPVRTARA